MINENKFVLRSENTSFDVPKKKLVLRVVDWYECDATTKTESSYINKDGKKVVNPIIERTIKYTCLVSQRKEPVLLFILMDFVLIYLVFVSDDI